MDPGVRKNSESKRKGGKKLIVKIVLAPTLTRFTFVDYVNPMICHQTNTKLFEYEILKYNNNHNFLINYIN